MGGGKCQRMEGERDRGGIVVADGSNGVRQKGEKERGGKALTHVHQWSYIIWRQKAYTTASYCDTAHEMIVHRCKYSMMELLSSLPQLGFNLRTG